MDLFVHPLSTPSWEQQRAAPARLSTRSVWAAPAAGESGAPAHRIIHQRAVFSDDPMTLQELRIVPAAGYHKCASGQESDHVTAVRAYVPVPEGWELAGESTGAPIDLSGIRTTALLAQVRRCATDGWWPGWNVVTTGLQLEGEPDGRYRTPPAATMVDRHIDLDGLPAGLTAASLPGEVRYRSDHLSIGFRLRSPALAYLSVDEDGGGRHDRSLLQLPRSMDIVRSGVYPSGVYPVLRDLNAEYLCQGPRLTLSDGRRGAAFLSADYRLSITVRGSVVDYDVDLARLGVRYRYRFVVRTNGFTLRISRTTVAPIRAWHSSGWQISTDNRVTPSAVVGAVDRNGETGGLQGPVLWHFPRHGCLTVVPSGPVTFRSDSVRPLDTNTFEIKLAEQVTDLGDYLLDRGLTEGEVDVRVGGPSLAPLAGATPQVVRRMLDRHAITALAFRPDTATYSNNGASMHCTTSLNDVSAIAERLQNVVPGVHPMDLVGLSLERWLTGAPSYGSGRTSHGPHLLEDECVHLAADTLLGLGRYLRWTSDDNFFGAHREGILAAIRRMQARDVDSDGLVESTMRLGRSGEHQWSTAWCDVLSFGWKDAWANAVLYDAWSVLGPQLERFGQPQLAAELATMAERCRSSYPQEFLNPVTGWVAGWRSADGMLHDYAFPLVTGTAVAAGVLDAAVAASAMSAMWREMRSVGPDLPLGVPLNLHLIPDEDIGGVVFGLPLGCYQQGGASHHRARVLVDALDVVGMQDEADELLTALAESIADDSAFGGLGSGRDWRMWDGTPSGYEGQLVEGFSVLSSALRRYGKPGHVSRLAT